MLGVRPSRSTALPPWEVWEMEVEVPVNTQAEVNVPKVGLKNVVVTEGDETVYQAGRYVEGVDGISAASESSEYVTFEAGSGLYRFRLKGS